LQINAEAKEKACDFVLYTDVTQTKKGSGLGMLKKLAPMAAAVTPFTNAISPGRLPHYLK